MIRGFLALCLSAIVGTCVAADLDGTPLEATTASGEKVRLFPNGRWEYIDAKKAAEAQQVAAQYPENKTRPIDAQGGWLPGTRTVMPGDKEYNRGSMNPKMR